MRAAALVWSLLLLAGFERAAALERSVCYITNWVSRCSCLVGRAAARMAPERYVCWSAARSAPPAPAW